MLEKIYLPEPKHMDLNIYRCGIEDCSSNYSWGPALRDHYIIHYILSGKGVYVLRGKTYNLSKGDGFLICPDSIVYYQADQNEPWSYGWVGFQGIKAYSYLNMAGLSSENPIFEYTHDDLLNKCLTKMIQTKNLLASRDIMLLGLLYEFISILVENAANKNIPHLNDRQKPKETYIKKVVEFVSMNYSRKISVKEMSSIAGIDRSYLYVLFKELISMSPQQFLINYRIDKACNLMTNQALSISEISRSVGYEDPLLFSKVFKQVKDMSPREYRRFVTS